MKTGSRPLLVMASCALALVALDPSVVAAGCIWVDPRTSASRFQEWCRCIGGTPFMNGGNWACTPPSGGGNDPRVQGAGQLGNAIRDALFGSPQEQERNIVEAEEAARRSLVEGQQRLAEAARQNQARYDRLVSELKLSDGGFDGAKGAALMEVDSSAILRLKLGDDADDGLRPRGTPFFGAGGDAGSKAGADKPIDPTIVDLRPRQGYAAAPAAPATAEPVGPPAGTGNAVAVAPAGETGFRAFQEATIACRKSHDAQLRQTEIFNQAQRRREQAARDFVSKKTALEKELAGKLATATLEEKHRLMANLFAEAKSEYDAWSKAKAEMTATISRERFETSLLLAASIRTSSPPPVGIVPLEILRQEREAIEPTTLERMTHEAAAWAARGDSATLDEFMGTVYLPVNDRNAESRVTRLVELVRANSPYPDETVHVKLYGAQQYPSPEKDLSPLNAFSTSNAIYFNYEYLRSNPSDDEIMFVAGHELAHIQRDHYPIMGAAHKREELRDWGRALLGTEESKAFPKGANEAEVREAVHLVRLQPLNYAQELEAERAGTAMALLAGANITAQRDTYARWLARSRPRSGDLELTNEHPTSRTYFEMLKRIYGEVMGNLAP